CPFGTLRWMRTSAVAMRLDKKSGTLMTLPASDYKAAITKRVANAHLTPDGSLHGEIRVEFEGQEALEHRLDALESDETQRKEDLQNEVRGWLQQGAYVRLLEVKGWADEDTPLMARFSLDIPGYSAIVGKRMMVPAYLFQIKTKEAFAHSER